jgi:hypothetical protein
MGLLRTTRRSDGADGRAPAVEPSSQAARLRVVIRSQVSQNGKAIALLQLTPELSHRTYNVAARKLVANGKSLPLSADSSQTRGSGQ